MKKPMVVGYKGEVGFFILGGLLKIMPKALDIWCVDINETEKEVAERIKIADVIFLCVPLQSTEAWLLKYKEQLKGKKIIEQCSLKEWIYENKKLRGLDIRSMHILFRPSQTPDLEDRSVGLFKGQFNSVMAETIAKITQSNIVWFKDALEHDTNMAVQQALSHRILLILGEMIKASKGSTYITKKILELESRVKKGDIGLYKKIQDNRWLSTVLEDFKGRLASFDIEKFWK